MQNIGNSLKRFVKKQIVEKVVKKLFKKIYFAFYLSATLTKFNKMLLEFMQNKNSGGTRSTHKGWSPKQQIMAAKKKVAKKPVAKKKAAGKKKR